MTVKLIVNNVGDQASAISTAGLAATHGDYEIENVISGPRSKLWRSVLTSNDKGIGYTLGANYNPDHVVVARADKLLTVGTYRMQGIRTSSWTTIAGFDKNPLVASDLMGPYQQDYCQSISSTTTDSWGVKFVQLGLDPEAAMISKVYFGIGFDYGQHVSPRVTQWVHLPKNQKNFATPLRGDLPFEIEARMSMVWQGVSSAKIDEFLALANVAEWPFFIYDPNQYVFPWKLEHVLLEAYKLQHKNLDIWDMQCILGRLRQYE